MNLEDGPLGPTLVLDPGSNVPDMAAKHALYMEGLFRCKAELRENPDGSWTVLCPGYDSVTFTTKKLLPATPAPVAPMVPLNHASLHRHVRRNK